jgi:hypothetical protein
MNYRPWTQSCHGILAENGPITLKIWQDKPGIGTDRVVGQVLFPKWQPDYGGGNGPGRVSEQMSLLKIADRYALELGYAPLALTLFFVFGIFDWRFWAVLICAIWLVYWVSRSVTRRVLRQLDRADP